MFLYHFHEPPPRHPRVFSVFYISLLLTTLPTPTQPPQTLSLSDAHMDSNRHTNTPSGGCTYSPSDRQSWSPPTRKLTETLLILPPVVVDTGYVSLHINYVSQQGCGEMCATLCARARMYVCPCLSVYYLWEEICECVYLFGSLCVFVFESSNVSEISQPCFIQ